MIAQKARPWLPLLLLLVFFALAMTQVRYASITFDEGPHLAVGYTTLRTHDLRLQPVHIHPPLANVLAALPLLLQSDLPDPTTVNGWEIASLSAITDALVWQNPHPARIATAGRVPILLLSTLLGALVFRWARDLGGWPAAAIALTLFALDPNLIAHSGLITTDAAAVTLSVATLYALYRWLVSPAGSRSHRRCFVLTGVLLGLAQLAKVSTLSLIPVVGLILFAQAWTHGRLSHALVLSIGRFLILVVIAGAVIWAGYDFELSAVEGVPFRVPAGTHFTIFRSLNEHYGLGHPTFAFGQVNDEGWWWYFPAAFLIKTPLSVLLLLMGSVVAGVGLLAQRSAAPGWSWPNSLPVPLTLGLFPVIYAAASLLSSVNIGYRHLLPLLPFLYVGAAQILTRLPTRRGAIRQTRRAAGALLMAWLALGTLRTLPTPLTHFNELAGGPSGGYRYLVDSNLDWGQNLWELASWMAENGEEHVRYAHYSPANPEVYGIDADFLPPDPRAVAFTPWRPETGLYAIGATVLQGPYAPDINTYAWFRARQPVARLGDALFVYRVAEEPAPGWVSVCLPWLSDSDLARRIGVEGVRTLRFDCNAAEAYPQRMTPGLTITPPEITPPEGAEKVLELHDGAGLTTSTVSRIDGSEVTPEVYAGSGLAIDGPLAFAGYALELDGDIVQPGQTFVLRTYWRVEVLPNRPLSLMAHATVQGDGDGTSGGPAGPTVAVSDGLGFPIEQWQVGDLIVQKHRLTLPTDLATPSRVTLETGAYWLDTLERWLPASGDSSIPLITLNVKAGR